jgi:hypothetical protein
MNNAHNEYCERDEWWKGQCLKLLDRLKRACALVAFLIERGARTKLPSWLKGARAQSCLLDWKVRTHKVAFLIERCAPRTCDELACDTHPFQCRSLELDMQEASATEVCMSTFSFFLRKRWAGKNSNRRGVSFRTMWTPTATGSLIRGSSGRCCCASVLGFLQESGQGKVGRNYSNRRGVSFRATRTPTAMRSLIQGSSGCCCYARVLGFLQDSG